jgi:hypothetical protein
MLVWCKGLDKTGALLRRLAVPSIQQTRRGKYTVCRRGADGHDVLVEHHERQPAVALERVTVVKVEDRLALLGLNPVIPRNLGVVLVRLAISVAPREEFAARDSEPLRPTAESNLGAFGPVVDEVDHGITEIVGNPALG